MTTNMSAMTTDRDVSTIARLDAKSCGVTVMGNAGLNLFGCLVVRGVVGLESRAWAWGGNEVVRC